MTQNWGHFSETWKVVKKSVKKYVLIPLGKVSIFLASQKMSTFIVVLYCENFDQSCI